MPVYHPRAAGPIAPAAFEKPPRLAFIDLLRGIVIILMALDHTRGYFAVAQFDPLDLEASNPAYFFTRFVTHFCAPVFILLTGMSAYLYRNARGANPATLSRFLLTRGVWLIFIEVALVSWAWQFGYQVLILQVIWAIGVSMIALSVLVFLPNWLIAAVAVALIAGHNLFDQVSVEAAGAFGGLWRVLHVPGAIRLPGLPYDTVYLVYPVAPWIGVIALGYVLASLLPGPSGRRDRTLFLIGAGFFLAFLLLRSFNIYGEPVAWSGQDRGLAMSVAEFLNVTKYPPSLQFVLVTLGPALMLMPLLARWQGPIAARIGVFGKVPFFFYLVHIPLIHALSLLWQEATFGTASRIFYDVSSWPEGYEPNLWRAYLVWAAVVFALYWPCKWFAGLKKRRKDWWLSYL